MDTITLEGKEFISSKRAAEITGYAKDYIGQLCREGRVESRLIGRNWYILESSVREHRFGKDASGEYDTQDTSTLNTSDDVADEEPLFAETVEEIDVPIPQTLEEEPKDDDEAIEDIQRAWKNWFSNRYVDEIPAPSEPEIPEGETVPIMHQESEPVTEEEKPIAISRIFPIEETIRTIQPSIGRSHRFVAAPIRGEALEMPPAHVVHEQPVRRRTKRSTLVLEAIFVAIAGLSLASSILGAGALDRVPVTNSLQAHAMRYVGGVISF